MSDEAQPPLKIPKRTRDQSKCIKCNKCLRHINGFYLKIETRKQAEDVSKEYGLHTQTGDSICSKCRSICRLNKSIRKRDELIQSHLDPSKLETTCSVSTSGDSKSGKNQDEHEIEEQMSSMSVESSQNEDVGTSSSQDTYNDLGRSQFTSKDSSQQTTGSSVSVYEPIEKIEVEKIVMPFPRTIATHDYCFKCKGKEDLQDVPFDARIQLFMKRKIFIPRRNRCCRIHLIKDRFYEDELSEIIICDNQCKIESSEFKTFLNVLSDSIDTRLHDKIANCSISEERLKVFTGYNWDNIFTLRDMMINMRVSENRNILQALVMFLMKLRTGNSDLCISAILEIDEKIVQKSIASVLKCFREEVLPKHFGYHCHTREFLLSQTSPVANRLHNLENRLALICDGTYLRHEKSNNNIYQRKSYSGQKKTALCKPFTITTTNGFVVNVEGPFNATVNDAQILKELIDSSEGLKSILRKGDIFILDRGFRDVVSYLKDKGYTVLMPALKGKRKQLTVEESNESRLVTKLRWVVEAVHGIVGQKFKLLHHQFHNSMLHSAGVYCQIACFLNNVFGKRLNSDQGKVDMIIDRINNTKNLTDSLAKFVEENNLNQKSRPFITTESSDLNDFPNLTIDELEILFTGTYQLSQAVCYLAEMLGENDSLSFKYAKEQTGLIRFEIKSRHSNSTTYKSYVEYQSKINAIEGIKRYCCSCANGRRTIGCCSHVAAIIYYLSYGRYLSRIPRPAMQLSTLFDFHSFVPVIEEDSDED